MSDTSFGSIFSYRVLSIVFAFINFVLILVSLLSPGWTAYYSSVDFFLIGLWTFCSGKFGCNFLPTFDVLFSLTRIIMVFAFLLSTIALVSTMPWDMTAVLKFHFFINALMTSIFSILAGIFTLVSLMLFEIYIHQGKAIMDGYTRKWGAFLAYVGCVMLFMAGGYNYFAFKYSLWGCYTSSSTNVDPENVVQEVNTEMSSNELTVET